MFTIACVISVGKERRREKVDGQGGLPEHEVQPHVPFNTPRGCNNDERRSLVENMLSHTQTVRNIDRF